MCVCCSDNIPIYVFACRAHGGADLWDKLEQLPSQQWWDWKRVSSEPVWLMASVSKDDHREDVLYGQHKKAQPSETIKLSRSILKWQGRQGHCFHSQSCQPSDISLAFISRLLWRPVTFLPFSRTSSTYCILSRAASVENRWLSLQSSLAYVFSSRTRFIVPFLHSHSHPHIHF